MCMVRKGGECLGDFMRKGRLSKERSNETALSLRSRRSGTKHTARMGCVLSTNVFQGASFGIVSCFC